MTIWGLLITLLALQGLPQQAPSASITSVPLSSTPIRERAPAQ
jgi:hypothetical protein